jgi:Skp family chaperone for outer membrane proteins
MSGKSTPQKTAPTTPEQVPETKPSPPASPPKPLTRNNATKDSEMDTFLSGVEGLTAAQKDLLRELYIANGQDAFDAEAAAVGRLKQEEYLAIPEGADLPTIKPIEVGRADTRKHFNAKILAAVYYLNKQRAPVGENAITYAMIRMEAVKMGWVQGQKEIIYVPFDKYTEALTEFATDLAGVKTQLATLRLAAFLIPLVCEHTFRVTGHHYITGLATDYQTRYRKTLKACLSEEVMGLLQPATLFHHVLHWVSPARSYNVLYSQLTTQTLPDAMVIRANSAPAGWAIITTTAAVLDAMESANVSEKVEEAFEGDLDEVQKMAKKIKGDVRKWHKAYYAYGVAPPSEKELEKMEEAKTTAVSFAPYAQGFIEGTLKDAALGQAQALKKHAELNPVAKSRAARFFRQLSRVEVKEVEDLFVTSLKTIRSNVDDE